jgi:hypothetical protein
MSKISVVFKYTYISTPLFLAFFLMMPGGISSSARSRILCSWGRERNCHDPRGGGYCCACFALHIRQLEPCRMSFSSGYGASIAIQALFTHYDLYICTICAQKAHEKTYCWIATVLLHDSVCRVHLCKYSTMHTVYNGLYCSVYNMYYGQ